MRLARGLPICHCISWNSNVPNEFLMNNKRHSYHLENFSCFTARSEDKDQIYSFGLLSAGFASQEWVIWQGISEAGKGHGKAIVGQRKWSYPFIKNVLKYLSGGVWVPVCSLSDFPGSIQFRCSVMSNSLRPHGPQHTRCPCPSPTPRAYPNSSIESVMTSNHLILCLPLLLLSSISPSIRVFLSESALCIRWPKYCSFSLSIIPSNGYSGLISFRMDCLDLDWESKRLSRAFSSAKVQKHQIFGAQPSLWSNSNILTRLLEKPKLWLWLWWPLSAKWCLCFLTCCLGLSSLFFQGVNIF